MLEQSPKQPTPEIQAEIERLKKVAERYAKEDAEAEAEKFKKLEENEEEIRNLLEQKEKLQVEIDRINDRLSELEYF